MYSQHGAEKLYLTPNQTSSYFPHYSPSNFEKKIPAINHTSQKTIFEIAGGIHEILTEFEKFLNISLPEEVTKSPFKSNAEIVRETVEKQRLEIQRKQQEMRQRRAQEKMKEKELRDQKEKEELAEKIKETTSSSTDAIESETSSSSKMLFSTPPVITSSYSNPSPSPSATQSESSDSAASPTPKSQLKPIHEVQDEIIQKKFKEEGVCSANIQITITKG